MARIRHLLAQVQEKLGLNETLLARAQRRYKANRKRAYKFHNQAIKAHELADRNRAEGGYNATQAPFVDQKAARLHVKAFRNHKRAEYWLGVIKKLTQRIAGLDADIKKIEAERKKLRPKVNGNKVEGGTPKQRWMLACLTSVANCANGKRRNFYSQTGSWDIDHELVGGPEYGHRSDCSSTVTGWAKAAQLGDPNGSNWTGGFTGTLVSESNGWKQVSLAALRKKGWGYIVYGSDLGHHTEAFTPSKDSPDRTSGHGSSPVDFGTVFLFGPSEYQRYYIYQPKKG
jgi:uncharacterized small protein (DUF1192 family)